MNKVLITGCQGFIGTALVNHLLKTKPQDEYFGISNHIPNENCKVPEKVNLVYADLTNKSYCSYIKRVAPDVVYHLAAISTPFSSSSNEDVWRSNTIYTMNLLEALPEQCEFVFTSTANIHGEFGYTEPRCGTVYTASKLACEGLIDAFVQQKRIATARVIRLTATIGPKMTHGMLPKAIQSIKKNGNYTFLNDSIKSFVYIDDAVEAIVGTLPLTVNKYRDRSYKLYTLGNNAVRLHEISKIIRELWPLANIAHENNFFAGDIKDSRPPIDFRNNYSSIEAIRKTLESYKD